MMLLVICQLSRDVIGLWIWWKIKVFSLWWSVYWFTYSQSSHKWLTWWKFEKVVVTRAVRLREWALVSYHILFYVVKHYRVVAYKSIRNSFIKKIKSNLCLTNVFIHVSGCRHGLSLHPNFLEQNNPKYRTALWCTVQDLSQQTISTVCSFIKVLICIK